MDELVLVVGADEPPPEPPPPPRRAGWAVLVVVVVGLFAWLGSTVDPGLSDEPSVEPLAVRGAPEVPEPTLDWSTLPGAWGDRMVDAGVGVLLGVRSWEADGGTWSLLVDERPTTIGSLPRDPVATTGADGRVWVAGRTPAGLEVTAIDPGTGRRWFFEPAPDEGRAGPDAVVEADGWVFVDAGDRVWSLAPDGAWTDHDLVEAVAADGDAVTGLAASYERVLEYRWIGERFAPWGSIEMEDEFPSRVTTTSGPGWAFAEACRGSDCRRFARAAGAGAWRSAPDTVALPRWNGSVWWSAGAYALRLRPPIDVSTDAVSWEVVDVPRFWLGSDEQAQAAILADGRVVIAVFQPDGTSTVHVGVAR